MLYMVFVEIKKYNKLDYISHQETKSKDVIEMIKELIDDNILYVSPTSSLDAFSDIDFPTRYNVTLVDFIVNVQYTKDDVDSIIHRKFDIQRFNKEDVNEYTKELMYTELLNNFNKMLNYRKICMSPSDKQLKDFKLLLNKLSYTQIQYLCYKVAVFYADGILTGNIYKSKVPKQILTSVNTFYYNSIQKYGSVYSSDPEYAGSFIKNYGVSQ